MKRVERAQPEIFSFSFLDILACTVGALAFILTIMLLNISSSFSKSEVLKDAERQLRELQEQLAELQQKNQQLTQESSRLKESLATLEPRANELAERAKAALAEAGQMERAAKAAKVEADEVTRQLTEAQDRLQKLQKQERELAERKAQLERERAQLNAKLNELQEKLAELQQRKTENVEEYLEAVAARDQNRQLCKQVQQLETTVGRLRKKNERNQQVLNAVAELERQRDELKSQITQTKQEMKEAEVSLTEATASQDEQPTPPPYLLLGLMVIAATILACVWLARRRSLPRGTPEELQAQTKEELQTIAEMRREIEQANETVQQRQGQMAASQDLQQVKVQVEAANRQAAEAEQKKQAAEDELAEAERQLAEVRQQKNASRTKLKQAQKSAESQVVPRAIEGPGGTSRKPTHVECTDSGLVIHPHGERVPESQIASARSAYGRLIREVAAASSSRCIVLWIRPGGFDTFSSAKDAAQECGAGIGWEPADRDWNFVF